MRTEELKLSLSGNYIPYVRDETGLLRPVHAAPLSFSQEAFLCAPEREVIAVGPRGGGKSEAMAMDCLSGIGRGWGSAYSVIIFRQNQGMLRDMVKLLNDLIMPVWPWAKYHQNNHIFSWPTGETIELYHFESVADFNNIQGREFAVICWDELCQWPTPECYLMAMSCLRSTALQSMPRKIRATANPLGAGHGWVKHRFRLRGAPTGVLPAISDSIGEDGKPELPRRAIGFPFTSNVLLMRNEPKYMQTIAAACKGNVARLRAWTVGDFDVVAGGCVDEIWYEYSKFFLIDEFEIPPGFRMYISFDWGSDKPYSVGFWAVSDGDDIQFPNGVVWSTKKGDLFRVGEIYGSNGKPDQGTKETASQITKRIVEYKIKRGWRFQDHTGRWIDRCKRGVADSQLFEERPGEPTRAEMYRVPVVVNGVRHPGVDWEKSTKGKYSRRDSLDRLSERLLATVPPREHKGLFVVEKFCHDFCRTLPILQRDEKDPDAPHGDQEDHCFDETGYLMRYVEAQRSGSMWGRTTGL